MWIAGPLSGLIVQPIVGVWADENKSRWGRRRPLIVIGTAVVAVSLFVLGFTRDIVGLVMSDDERAKRPTIVLAVVAIYVVDFAINVGTYNMTDFLLFWELTGPSHVMLEESDCRYTTNREATGRRSLV